MKLLLRFIRKIAPIGVDDIMAEHTATIERLERHANYSDDDAAHLDEKIEKLIEKRDAHLAESKRASVIAIKMKQLLGEE